MPASRGDSQQLELDARDMAMLLAGVSLSSPKRRRYAAAG